MIIVSRVTKRGKSKNSQPGYRDHRLVRIAELQELVRLRCRILGCLGELPVRIDHEFVCDAGVK
jgi:hypothetical protein